LLLDARTAFQMKWYKKFQSYPIRLISISMLSPFCRTNVSLVMGQMQVIERQT
jgi:hypothetical protein